MKTLKIIIASVALVVVAGSVYQFNSELHETEVKMKDCTNGKFGLFQVAVDYDGKTYTGGTEISAGMITGSLTSESVLVLRSKGFFNQIASYK